MRGLELSVAAGERVLLLGASGSGKSTVLAALAGVLGGSDEGESQGVLSVDGRDATAVPGRAGLLLQDPDAQVILARVGDDVAFAAENLGVQREEIWRRVSAGLNDVGLPLPLDHPTAQLSGGQKQRLALAGLLAMQPGLLLLDEPTANLDPGGVVDVRDAVARVVAQTGATLVVVEHRVAVWHDVVDRVIVLAADGGLLADGEPEAVLRGEAERLREAGVWLPDAVRGPVRLGGFFEGHSLLEANGLSIARARDRPLGEPIDLAIATGSATAITGENGVGKSTLALTLGGLLKPHAGEVAATLELAAGADTAPIRWSSRQLLTRIGTVFQNPEHQFVAATVRAELAAGPRALRVSRSEVDERIEELLVRLRLTELAEANPFTLSGGQKRRLSVATALATRPRILMLDEPTFGQDANTWRELVSMVLQLRDDGHAIVAVTHDAHFVEAIGAREWHLGGAVSTPLSAGQS